MDEPGNAPEGAPETFPDLPEAALRRRRPSLVWFIPLVAAVIGAWIALKSYTEKGPTITITFQSADGLEAGQTRIRNKGVEIGKVTAIDLSRDFRQVVVTAELRRDSQALLSENSRFWIVRANISTDGISGLGTILSGAYIGMDPGPRGKPAQAFNGLETAPRLMPQLPGELIELRAERLGSLNLGSPVTFRQVRIGQVAGYDLDPDGRSVIIKVLVHPPYHGLIHSNTRFWDAGGVDLSLDANGLRLHSDSLVQVLLGGIALENPTEGEAGPVAPVGQVFTLFPNRDKAYEQVYRDRRYFVLNFDESIRGLSRGAPVEFRGVKVGDVEDFRLEFDTRKLEGRIPVLIALEPERFTILGSRREDLDQLLAKLVRKGLRAQLKVGSVLTGNLFVDLGFHPGARSRILAQNGPYREIPTMPSTMGTLLDTLTRLAERVQNLPLEEVVGQARATLPVMRETLRQAGVLMAHLDQKTTPQAEATLAQARTTLAALEAALRTDSPNQTDLRQALDEFTQAACALRNLADTLERHPESLLFGKGKQP